MLVDTDGETRSALEIVLREAMDAGVRDVALIVRPRDEDSYRQATGACGDVVQFIHQSEPLGYGHALSLAEDFVGQEPFLHLVGDHLYVSNTETGCAKQLIEVAVKNECAVSAVQSTRETNLHLYGTVGGHKIPGQAGIYEVECVCEKPTPTLAEQKLVIPGLRAGQYLCFFGMHVLTPAVLVLLKKLLKTESETAKVQLSDALHLLSGQEKYLACELAGDRQNIGIDYGLFYAQMGLALRGVDRETVLAEMVQLLATRYGAAE